MVELDRLFPHAPFREIHTRRVRSDPANVWKTLRAIDFADSRPARILFLLRGITSPSLGWSDLERLGFVPLHAHEPHELVYGLVARPWSLAGGIRQVEAADFPTFVEPGYAVIGWNYHLQPDADETIVTTETRVRCTDPSATRSFRRYWAVVRPFSGFIRSRSLALLAGRVEGGDG